MQVEKRENLIKYLNSKKIGTAIHYPIPIHLQHHQNILNIKKVRFQLLRLKVEKF